MREIKFRGKSEEDGKWYYGDLSCLLSLDRKENVYQITGQYKDIFTHNVIFESVGEYTGLKDKNGKEIYEGDMIKDCDSELIEEVVYYINEWCEDGFFTGYGPLSTVSENYEIIVNKYENPELLK